MLELLSGAYPEKEITKREAATCALLWADADASSMRVAALAYMRSSEKYFPRPGVLLRYFDELDAPTPEEAWGEVHRAISSVGSMGMPDWSHPRIGLAVRAVFGEWSSFCKGALTCEMVSHRVRFIDAYRGIESRDRDRLGFEEAKLLIVGFPSLEGVEGIGLLPEDARDDEVLPP